MKTLKKLMGVIALVCSLSGLCAGVASACEEPQLNEANAIYWSREPHDADDAPFRQIRKEVDRSVTTSKSKVSLVQRFKQAALKSPKDAKAQFRWAYAAYEVANSLQADQEKTKFMCGVYAWMGQPKNPQAFEYARLRFLVAKVYSPWHSNKYVNELGIRLLKKALKDDFDLRYFGIDALAGSAHFKAPEPLEEAFRLALVLKKDFPGNPEPAYLLAGIYGSRFAILKKSVLADLSARYARKYLQMEENPAKRQKASAMIERIERLRMAYKRNGQLRS